MRSPNAAALTAILAIGLSSCSSEPSQNDGYQDVQQHNGAVSASASQGEPTVSLFITYREGAAPNRVAAMLSTGSTFVYDVLDRHRMYMVMPKRLLSAFAASKPDWIAGLEVDSTRYFLSADLLPWGVDASDAEVVQANVNKGTGVKIAFVDGGANCGLLDLNSRLVGGHDFILNSSSYCYADEDASKHGSSVAGILAASINGSGVLGMAPEASLYSLRVCQSNIGCPTAMIAAALDWSRQNGMQVVNLSIGGCGGPVSSGLQASIADLYTAGIPQVWAAGNGTDDGCAPNSPVSGPAALPGTIAVSAYLQDGSYLPQYQHGPEIDLTAATNVFTDFYSGGTWVFGGTSASTPHVAGAIALLIKEGFTGPTLILQRLTETATDRGTPGKDNFYGWGTLNAGGAVVLRPRTTSIDGPASPITLPGTYPISASFINGIQPFQVKWEITYSNNSHAPVSTGFGANSYPMEVPAGSYTITITATPKEQVYLRVGFPVIRQIPVCTTPALRPHASGEKPVGDSAGGC